MTVDPIHANQVRLLPSRLVRAALLALMLATAAATLGAAWCAAEAWRLVRDGAGTDVKRLNEVNDLHRLAEQMQQAFGAGAWAFAGLWTFVTMRNVRQAARSWGSALFVSSLWLAAPAAAYGLSFFSDSDQIIHLAVVALILETAVLYLPFGALGSAALMVGSTRAPFRRWYLAVALAYLIYRVFGSELQVADSGSVDDFGRSALMILVSGVVALVATVMAADATQRIHIATVDKIDRHHHMADDALSRFVRSSAASRAERSSPM